MQIVPSFVVAVALVAATAAVPASAHEQRPASFIPLGEEADPPAGYVELCRRDPAECEPGDTAADLVGRTADRSLVTAATRSGTDIATAESIMRQSASRRIRLPDTTGARDAVLLKAVNRAVNRHTRQISDLARFGVDERWERPAAGPRSTGDCEDLALEKRSRLIAQGFPADRLFLAVVYRRAYGLHTVLLARIESGDVVLDSLSERIQPWNRRHLAWLRVQSPGKPGRWHRIQAAA